METNSKYKGLEESLADEISFCEDKYFCYDEPVPFCGLLIYPITLRNYNEFFSVLDCFLLDKNRDPEGIRYNHLDYILLQMKDEKKGAMWSYKFSRLIELIFHITNGIKCSDCNNVMTYEEYFTKIKNNNEDLKENNVCCTKCNKSNLFEVIKYVDDGSGRRKKLVIDKHDITSKDYERLRKIVIYQNLPDYKDDSKVDAALKKDYDTKMELLSKDQGKATLEKKIVAVATKSSYKISELYDMSIRKFNMLLYTIDDVIDYVIKKTAMMSGMVSYKEPIEHWIYKNPKDMYGSSYVTPEEIKQKLG